MYYDLRYRGTSLWIYSPCLSKELAASSHKYAWDYKIDMVGNASFSYCKAESNTERKSDCLFLFVATPIRRPRYENCLADWLGNIAGVVRVIVTFGNNCCQKLFLDKAYPVFHIIHFANQRPVFCRLYTQRLKRLAITFQDENILFNVSCTAGQRSSNLA